MPASQQRRPRRAKTVIVEQPVPWYKRAQNVILVAVAIIGGAASLLANITAIKTSLSELFGGQAQTAQPVSTTPITLPPSTVPTYVPSPNQASPNQASPTQGPIDTPSKAPFYPPEAPSKFSK